MGEDFLDLWNLGSLKLLPCKETAAAQHILCDCKDSQNGAVNMVKCGGCLVVGSCAKGGLGTTWKGDNAG